MEIFTAIGYNSKLFQLVLKISEIFQFYTYSCLLVWVWKLVKNSKPVYLLMFCRARINLRISSSLAPHSLKLRLISWSARSCSTSSDWNFPHRASTETGEIPTTCSHCFTDGIFLTSAGKPSVSILALANNCLLKSLTSFP